MLRGDRPTRQDQLATTTSHRVETRHHSEGVFCRIGPTGRLWRIHSLALIGSDGQAVVDSRGLVHGLDGLRVADASIFPQIVNCNLNATVIMVAEKISDEIKKKHA